MNISGKFKRLIALFTVIHFMGWSTAVFALPTGWEVIEGSASFELSDNVLTITSTVDKTVINYISFNLSNGETINFIMPNAGSSIINQVIGGNISNIAGTINANGVVGLVNTSGIMIANSAQIQAASLLASTLNIGSFDANAIALKNNSGTAAGIVNEGQINITNGGYAILAGSGIHNVGQIIAEDGTINLAVGDSMTFHLSDSTSVAVTIDEGLKHSIDGLNTAITNQGDLLAHQVDLSAKLSDKAADVAVNNEGIVQATALGNVGGKIVLHGVSDDDSGTLVANQGILNASGTVNNAKAGHIYIESDTVYNSGANVAIGLAGEKGGTVQMLGNTVINEGSYTDASGDIGGGEVYIGGDFQGTGDMRRATLNMADHNTMVFADAFSEGNGGKVIFWSDENTHFLGAVSATGGAASGDGGFTEISGKGYLNMKGDVDLTAANGNKGQLLLDPTNILITEFDPTDPGAVGLWFDAADASTITTSGSDVTQWDDKSGGGNHAYQSTSSERASTGSSTINGLNTLTFNGTSDHLAISNKSYTGNAANGLSVFSVQRTATNGRHIVLSYDRSETFRYTMGDDTLSNNTQVGFDTTANGGGGTRDMRGSTNIIGGSGALTGAIYDRATGEKSIYVNGTQDTVGATTGNHTPGVGLGTTTTRFGFIGTGSEANSFDGSRGPNNYFQGDIGEILMYDKTLSYDETMQVQQYLAAKWGQSFNENLANISVFNDTFIEYLTQTSDVSLQADNNITVADLSDDMLALGSRNLTLTATNGTIAFSDLNDTIRSEGGDITFNAGTAINIGHLDTRGASGLVAGGHVTLNGGDSVSFGSINTNNGNITLSNDYNLDGSGIFNITSGLLSTINSNGGDLSFSGEHVSINTALNSGGGNISLIADQNGDGSGYVNFTSSAALNSAGGDIYIEGDRLLMQNGGGSIAAGAGNITLVDDGVNDNEDVRINSGFSITGNNLTVTSNHDFENYNNSTVTMTGAIDVDADDDIISYNSDMTAAGNIDLKAGDGVQIRGVTSTGGYIHAIADNDGDGAGNVTTYDGVNITTSGAAITLEGENVAIYDDINSNGGVITVIGNRAGSTGTGLINQVDGVITSGNANVVMTSGNILLNGNTGGRIVSGTGDVNLTSNGTTDSYDIQLTNGFNITGRNLTANSTYDFEVYNDSLINMTNDVTVFAADDILANSGDIRATRHIDLRANDLTRVREVTTTTGNITLVSDNDANGTGDFILYAGNNLNSNGGDIRVEGENVTLDSDINAAGGDIFLIANRDNAGNGQLNFNTDADINTANGNLTMQGADLYFNGATGASITTGTGDITITENGATDANDVYFNNGFTMSGRNLTVNSNHDITIYNGSTINMTGTVNMTAGDDFDANSAGSSINAGSTVVLTSGDDLNIENVTSTAGSITLNAADNISVVNSLVTNNQLISINADENLDEVGTFSLTAGSLINANGGDIELRGESVTLDQAINSGGGDVTIVANRFAGTNEGLINFNGTASINSAGGDIDLSAADLLLDGAGAGISAGTGNVTLADNGTVDGNDVRFNNGFVLTGNNLVITSNHDIEGYNDSLINMTGTVSMTANDDILFSSADIRAGGNITMNARDALQIREVTSTTGNIIANADSDRDGVGNLDTYVGNNITTSGGGTITLTGEHVTLRDNIDSNGGLITLSANAAGVNGNGQLRIYPGMDITSDNGNIVLNGGQFYWDGDDGALATSSIASGTGDITITENGTIDDNDVYIFDGFDITGRNLTVNANHDFVMRTGASINMTGTVDIDAIGDDVDISTGGGTITAVGTININAADNNIVDQVTSTGANVILSAGDAVTLNTGVTSNSGGIQILADNDLNDTGNFTLTNASAINANGGDITIRAESITLNDTIDSNGGDIILNANRFAGVGNGLINFNAGASVISDNGDITMTGADLILDGGAGNAIIAGTGNVNLADNGTNDANDVYIYNNFVLTGNNLVITSNHDVTVGLDSLINMTGTVDITSNKNISANTGDIRAGGNINLSALDHITVREVTSTTGSITIDADSDANGTGNLTTYAGNNITTNGTDITLRGEYINLQDELVSNGGDITVLANRDAAGDGDVDFTGAVNITSGGGTITLQGADVRLDGGGTVNSGGGDINLTDNGATDSVDVYLDGITLTGRNITMTSNHDVQMVNNAAINATGFVLANASDEVHFQSGDVTAVGDINLNANTNVNTRSVVTTTGNITLSSDHDNDGTGNFVHSTGNVIDSNGGNIAILGENVTIQNNIISDGGDITLTANRDAAGNGTFNIDSDADILSSNGDIYIQGGEILLDAGANSDINAGTGDITIVENGTTDGNDVRMNQVDIIGRNITITSNADIDMITNATITASGDVHFDSADTIDTNAGQIVAAGDILFEADLHIYADDLTTTAGNITLEADDNLDGFGNVDLRAGDQMITNGGNLTLLGENVTFGTSVNTGGGDITFAANRNNDAFGTFDMYNGTNNDYISGGGDINITGAELLLRTNTLGSTIQAGAGDVNITDNNANGTYDVYFHRGLQVSGRDINVTSAGDIRLVSNSPALIATRDINLDATASLLMDTGSSITAGRDFVSTAGTTSSVRDITAGGNLAVVSGGDITSYNNGLIANGSAGWNGASDETMIIQSTGGSVLGTGYRTTGAGNMRLQAGSNTALGGTRVVQVNNLQASGDVGIYATGSTSGISIGVAGTSSIAGDLTATGITASNYFGATSGDITITTTSGNIDTAMVWSADDVTLNANNGSIIQSAAKYGTAYNNNKTIYAGKDITLRAAGGAGSYIDTGVMTLNSAGTVNAQASGANAGRSIQLIGTSYGDLSASGIGGAATTGDVWLGNTLGADPNDLNDTDFVMDVTGNTYVNAGGAVNLYGGFGANGSATIYGTSLDANIDKWDFTINDINVSGAAGINIKTQRGSILGNAVRTTNGAASVTLEAGTDPLRDKMVHVDLNSLNTSGNLLIEVTGSSTGNAAGSSVDITAGAVGGSTTVTDEAGGATLGTVNTP